MKDMGNTPGLSSGVNLSHTLENIDETASFQGTPTQALWASAKNPVVPSAEVTHSLNKKQR